MNAHHTEYARMAEDWRSEMEDVDARSGASGGRSERSLSGRAEDLASRALWLHRVEPNLTTRYLVKGWLDRGTASVVYGESNVGKTFFALDVAMHVAARIPWNGHRVAGQVDWEALDRDSDDLPQWPGPVVYAALEGGHGFANRLEALKRARSHLTCRASDGEFVAMPINLDLHDANFAADFERAVTEVTEGKPCLIVIDTLARAMGGDENSSQDMSRFVANIDMIRRAFGCHLMLVHHSGKDTTKGARGSSVLRAAIDTEIELTRSGNVVTAEARKQRDQETGGLFGFTLRSVVLGQDEDGDDVTSAVVEPADPIKRTAPITGQAKIALQAFSDALAHHGEKKTGDMFPANRKCVSIDQWRTYCDRHALTDGDSESASRQAFIRARRTLADKGVIKIVDGFAWRVGDEA